jgi:ZIP family zinc transporter
MGLGATLVLGFIAGATILIGLPIGRMRSAMPKTRLLLNAGAVGVLLFLLWDVLSAAWEPIDSALGEVHDNTGGLGPVFGYGVLFAAGLAGGLFSLVGYDRFMRTVARRAATEHAAVSVHAGSGATTAGAHTTDPAASPLSPATSWAHRMANWSPGRRLAVLIAVGIGLHNFAEGLAIGQAAAQSEIALATLLVIGFALHNATEGFGIVAPLGDELDSDGRVRQPSWAFLLSLGAVGGGPTFIGTAVGHSFTSEALSVVFLTLAAGSIIFVVAQMLGVAARARRPDLLAQGLLIGLLAGFITDAIVTAAGV